MIRLILSSIALIWAFPAFAAETRLKLLFLGDSGHHRPAERFQQIELILKAKGIDLTYTEKLDDLNPANLARFAGLIIYANQEKIAPAQEKALLDFVASGKGFIPLHCASYCFLSSPAYINLVGAQFRSHQTGTFSVENVKPDHPIMKGYPGFTSWDETYLHHKHNNKDRTVLEVRGEGDSKEPWTWVRTQGKGRVFYTAWGHDQRTWGHPGFQNLLERGIRWACGQDPSLAGTYFDKPEMTPKRTDVKPFEYVEAKIPLYVTGAGRGRADRANKMQKPLDAEESKKHFVVPKDFEVRTFVTEEKLGGKPLTMAWDEQGRLYVSLTLDYPNELKPPGQGRDRIVICEDLDGDGVCDKVTVFADKLSIPTSILPFRGGVIVHSAPETLFLKDTDGDGKADVRQMLFTGWGTHDTHAGPSNLRYGFDNWVYGMVGYSGFNGKVAGEKLSFKQGMYRFKVEVDASPGPSPQNPTPGPSPKRGGGSNSETNRPAASPPSNPAPPLRFGEGAGGWGSLKVTKLEFLRSTSNNSWGLGFSEDGQLFGSTANGCPLVHMTIPNRYYEKVRGLTAPVLPCIAADNHIEPITDRVRQVDFHGGFTAAAGCSLYTARTYPKEYWNRVSFVCEPTGHLCAAMLLEPDGATYKARYGWNLLASDDEWSAPIQAEVGPDGHVWVIDWYNFIVQHNPTPAGFKTGKGGAYETPLRDKTHGRIYRVVYTKAKAEPRVNLKDATPEKLVETLKHHNMGWRMHAQRLLVENNNIKVSKLLERMLFRIAASRDDAEETFQHFLFSLQGIETNQKLIYLAQDFAGIGRFKSPQTQQAIMSLFAANWRNSDKPDWWALLSLMNKWKDKKAIVEILLIISDTEQTKKLNSFIMNDLLERITSVDSYANEKDAFIMAICAHAELFIKYYMECFKNGKLLRALSVEQVKNFVSISTSHIASSGSADSINSLISAICSGPYNEAFDYYQKVESQLQIITEQLATHKNDPVASTPGASIKISP